MSHVVRPTRDSLHGQWSSELEPALIVDPGDTVVFENTLDVSWGTGQHVPGAPTRPRFAPRIPRDESPRDDGPALHGPVHVRGAETGQGLVVHIDAVVTDRWGWTWHGPGPFNRTFNERIGLADPEHTLVRWDLDPDAGVATAVDGPGWQVPLAPFPGCIGVCPEGEGWHSGWSPTRFGGNLDCSELVAGTTLRLPIGQPGAGFSLGDGHATQGDGELAGTAIECRMQRVRVRFELEPRGPASPLAARGDRRIACGVGETLDDAAAMAVSTMLDALVASTGWSRPHALAWSTFGASVRVTQLVNGVVGAHAVWTEPKRAQSTV